MDETIATANLPEHIREEKKLPDGELEIRSVKIETEKAVLATLDSVELDGRRSVGEHWIPKRYVQGTPPEPEQKKQVSKNPEVWVERGTIKLRAEYKDRDRCRVGNGEFNKREKVWEYRSSPGIAEEIEDAFDGLHLITDDKFRELLAKAENYTLPRRQERVPEPPSSKSKSWHHQKQAFWFAESKPAVMLDMKMGVGKSKVAIDLMAYARDETVLILGPRYVVKGWPKQLEEHCLVPYEILTLHEGSVPEKAVLVETFLKERREGVVHVVALNYESAWRDPLYSVLSGVEWDRVIADESHRIKGADSKQSNAAYWIGKNALRRMALSGTPMAESPLDVYGQYRFLDDSIFGANHYKFLNRYAVQQEIEVPFTTKNGKRSKRTVKTTVGVKNKKELYRNFSSIAFTADDSVLDLPPVHEIDRYFDLPEEAVRIYNSLESTMQAIVEEEGRLTPRSGAVRSMRLQQITSGFAKLDPEKVPQVHKTDPGKLVRVHDEKRDLLGDILGDLPKSEPVVVFCQFIPEVKLIREAADSAGREAFELTGRADERDEWKEHTGGVLAVNVQAGGEGINDLVHARYVVYYSVSHVLKDYEQSFKRIHRPGQDRSVTVYHLIANPVFGEPSMDHRVRAALRDKKDVIESMKGDYE